MQRKYIYAVLACSLVSIGVVIGLIGYSGVLKDKRGSFLRQFPPHPVLEGDTINIVYNTYYLAGGTVHTVYLGNYSSPLHLLVVDLVSLDTQHVWLSAEGVFETRFWSLTVQVDSPYVYLVDGAVPRIYQGLIGSRPLTRYPQDRFHFREVVALDPDEYIVKTLMGESPENVVGKITSGPPHFRYTDEILEKQIDGLFCTDGMLRYSRERGWLVYTYYYRNNFLVMDRDLLLVYRGHTLDTISRAQLKVATLSATGEHMLASPPVYVNKRSCVSGKYLFINSGIPARNQARDALEHADVVDVYELGTGDYRFSFVIYPFWGTKRMMDFMVLGRKMVVLYDGLIRVYDLMSPYFDDGYIP
jgi:hypothetical protein